MRILLLSLFIVILLTVTTPCSSNSDCISCSVQFNRSISDITPFDVFKVELHYFYNSIHNLPIDRKSVV